MAGNTGRRKRKTPPSDLSRPLLHYLHTYLPACLSTLHVYIAYIHIRVYLRVCLKPECDNYPKGCCIPTYPPTCLPTCLSYTIIATTAIATPTLDSSRAAGRGAKGRVRVRATNDGKTREETRDADKDPVSSIFLIYCLFFLPFLKRVPVAYTFPTCLNNLPV